MRKLMVSIMAMASLAPLWAYSATTLITSFESDDPTFTLGANNDGVQTVVTDNVTDGVNAWRGFLGTPFTGGIKIYNSDAWDWSGQVNVAVDVTNTSSDNINFGIKALSNFIWDEANSLSEYFNVAGNTTATIEFLLDSTEFGSLGASFNKAQIMELQFFAGNTADATLYFDNIRVNGDPIEETPEPEPEPELSEIDTAIATAPVQTLLLVESFDSIPDTLLADEGITLELSEQGVSQGSGALRVLFPAGGYAALRLTPSTPWDWSGLGEEIALALDVSNPHSEAVSLFLRVGSDPNADDGLYANRAASIAANASQTINLSLNDLAALTTQDLRVATLGIRELPATPALDVWGNDWLALDHAAITSVRVFLAEPAEDTTLVIDNLRIIKDLNHTSAFAELVDARGQNNQITYPYKVAKATDLAELGANEAAEGVLGELRGGVRNSNGYASHPSLQPTVDCVLASPASFNACKDGDGKWHLVDPEGYAFFATGLANIRLTDTYTMTGVASEGEDSALRQSMFVELPTSYIDESAGPVHSGPISQGQAASFYANNLVARHGSEEAWRALTLKRMKDWGFTSLGNWTDPAFYGETDIPYFASGWTATCNGAVGCGEYKTIGDGYWSGIPDPWDPQFVANAELMAQQISSEVSGATSLLVGVFVDNEISWGGDSGQYDNENQNIHAQTMAVFATDATVAGNSPAKESFISIIQASWGLNFSTIAQLNSAWGTSFASFDDLRPAFAMSDFYDGTQDTITASLNTLQYFYALQYFNVVKTALNTALPNHLYLGARFADWGRTTQVVQAASDVVDVLSYNIYKESVTEDDWDSLALSQLAALDKPAIIGEFHMGSLDSANFSSGLVVANSQQRRAEKMVSYLTSVNDNAQFVGAHWFQYIDSPLSGRAWDGENYNVGFVTATDTPYTEMTDAARIFNCYMYVASFKTQCEQELSAISVDVTAKANLTIQASTLYSGANVGVLHRGPQAPEPEDDVVPTPEEPVVPDEPETPQEPAPPEEPEVPEQPEAPDEPEAPEQPDTPDEPEEVPYHNGGGSSSWLVIVGLALMALVRRKALV